MEGAQVAVEGTGTTTTTREDGTFLLANLAPGTRVLVARKVQSRLEHALNLFPAFSVHLCARCSIPGAARPWPPASPA